MTRIVFWATLFSLLMAITFGLAWVKWIHIPFLNDQNAEAFAFLLASFGALVGYVYQLRQKAYKKPAAPRYLAAPPSHLLPGILPRPEELRHIHTTLLSAQQPLVVHGIGGLGKTTFAQQYCHDYGGRYEGVVWLPARAVYSNDAAHNDENNTYFLNAFIENKALIANLSLTFGELETPEDRFQKVIAALANMTGMRLLVIDNTPAIAARYAAELSQLKDWRILLTSREALHNMASFSLSTLPPDKAAQVFCNVYGERSPDRAIDEIIQAYGYHTLTIELLAAYAREKNLRPITLRDELDQRGLLLLDAYELRLPNSGKVETLSARLLDTFLLDLGEKEQEIMRYMCLLPTASSDIDPELMSENQLSSLFDLETDKAGFHNLLYGLARLNWLVEKDGSFYCHPVIAETAKAQLRPDVVNCGILIGNVTDLLIPDEDTNEPVINCAPFAPLGEAVFSGAYREDREWMAAEDVLARLALRLGWLFSDLGEVFKALEYNLKVVEIREKVLPPESLELALSYNNLAQSYGSLGKLQNFLEYHQKALTIRRKLLPGDHPHLASSYNNLALAYSDLGKHQECLKYQRKALAIRRKVLSPEHPNLALSYNNLAETFGALGNHQKRLEYNLKAIAIREKILHPEHPDLAQSYNNLAATYGNLGKHEKRLEYNQKALAIREKVLPLEHPDLAQLYNNLAATHFALEDLKKSLEYHQKALAIQEKVLPLEHPDLALSYNNLATTYGGLGEHQKALEYNQKALDIRRKVLPSEHPHLASSYSNIAWVYYNLGDISKAVTFMRCAVIIREKALPPTHQNVIKARTDLATFEAKLKSSEP